MNDLNLFIDLKGLRTPDMKGLQACTASLLLNLFSIGGKQPIYMKPKTF